MIRFGRLALVALLAGCGAAPSTSSLQEAHANFVAHCADPALPDAQKATLEALRRVFAKSDCDELRAAIEADDRINIAGQALTDVSVLTYFPHLTRVSVGQNQLTTLAPLGALPLLDFLAAADNQLTDVSAFSTHPKLTTLDVRGNRIEVVPPLKSVKELRLDGNPLRDLGGLARSPALQRLLLNKVGPFELPSMLGAPLLELIAAEGNSLQSVGGFAHAKSLKQLYLGDNQIKNAAPLSGLKHLEVLSLAANGISNLAPLSGLSELKFLYLSENQLTSFAALSGLTKLQYLDLRRNPAATGCPVADPDGVICVF